MVFDSGRRLLMYRQPHLAQIEAARQGARLAIMPQPALANCNDRLVAPISSTSVR
jgi:hypothetical protein